MNNTDHSEESRTPYERRQAVIFQAARCRGRWRNKRTGHIVSILNYDGERFELLSESSGRKTTVKDYYFAGLYEPTLEDNIKAAAIEIANTFPSLNLTDKPINENGELVLCIEAIIRRHTAATTVRADLARTEGERVRVLRRELYNAYDEIHRRHAEHWAEPVPFEDCTTQRCVSARKVLEERK